jgi:cytoskeletal protein CcmA (bactofilin family)
MSNTIRPQSKITVVEEGTEFRGTLTSSCPIDVRGRVEGDLQTPALTVSASGAVHGRVKVGEVRSEGEISGEFDADKIELAGTVRDNTVIRARSLDVKIASSRGKLQLIFGECELAVGDEPRETDHLESTASVPAAAAPVLDAALAAPAVPAEAAAIPAPEAPAQAAAEEEEEEADGSPAEAGAKRKRRRKNGQDEHAAGWSQPPSQPPPAS